MPRIAIVTTSYPARPGDASGHFVAAEAEALVAAGHEVHVICPGRPRRSSGGLTLHACGGGSAFGWPGVAARVRDEPGRAVHVLCFLVTARRRLRRLAAAGLDEVRAHWMVPSGWPIAAATNTPLQVMCHGGDVRLLAALPLGVRRRIVADVVDRAHQIVFCAERVRQQLHDAIGIDLAARLAAISTVQAPPLTMHLPDTHRRASVRAELCHAEDLSLVAIVGRLVPGKRVDLAIDAIASVGLPVRLVVVGDGPARTQLERHADSRGVDVRFEGQREHAATHDIIAACDVLLHTSLAEGAPTVVREARRLGVAVVATASGDLQAWATADSGIAIAAPTAAAIAAGIARALSAPEQRRDRG